MKTAILGLWVLCSCSAAAAAADRTCQVVDLMPRYWQLIETSDAPTRIRAGLLDRHPDLYNKDYVNLPAGPTWETTVARERAYAQAHREQITAAERYLSANAQPFMRRFRRTFPDFTCNFTYYIAPSFGQMDGSAAFVGGQHRIIFAPDVIPRYHELAGLKILIDHETFHIYHHQATNLFGASDEAVPTILEALWGEGLATFVSWQMNPAISLDTALLQPGIPQAADAHLADIARDLLTHLDAKDEPTFLHYFVAGKQPQGYPPRAGYYVGALIARDLAARYTLAQLAHLNGPDLHRSVVSALEQLAARTP